MILTTEDISAVKVAVAETLEPRFTKIDERFKAVEMQISKVDEQISKVDEQILSLTHLSNKRFTAIEVRLDAIEYKLQQIAVFIPFENAFLIPPVKKRATD